MVRSFLSARFEMIEVKDIHRSYDSGNTMVQAVGSIRSQAASKGFPFVDRRRRVRAVDGISFQIANKEFIAITGPSGSGKSTLLALLAGLDRPTKGQIFIDDEEINTMSEAQLSQLRGKKIGFIFQNFQLIPTMTALENVRIPAEIRGDYKTAKKAMSLLKQVHLGERANHYPHQLSGGEMQRVAIARAFILQPEILLADEPTGNLDTQNGNIVIDMLQKIGQNSTLILITHDHSLAELAQREIRLKDGKIDKIIKHHKKTSKVSRKMFKKAKRRVKK